MSRILLALSRYIQGSGSVNEIGTHAKKTGTKVMLIRGKSSLSVCSGAIQSSLRKIITLLFHLRIQAKVFQMK